MNDIGDILKKANMRAVSDYMLYGRNIPQSDNLTYEERNDNAFVKCMEQINDNPEELESALDELGMELSLLFFEIGVKAGMNLALELTVVK